jgi:hypothetical protein
MGRVRIHGTTEDGREAHPNPLDSYVLFLFYIENPGKPMALDHIRAEIEHMRTQVGRQRREILQLQRAGISTASAELLLERMLAKIDTLCAERDRLKKELPGHMKGKVLGGRQW